MYVIDPSVSVISLRWVLLDEGRWMVTCETERIQAFTHIRGMYDMLCTRRNLLLYSIEARTLFLWFLCCVNTTFCYDYCIVHSLWCCRFISAIAKTHYFVHNDLVLLFYIFSILNVLHNPPPTLNYVALTVD